MGWLLALVLVTISATPVRGADDPSKITLQINRVYTESTSCPVGCPTVIVTVTNRSAYHLGWIFIDCAFLSNGVPMTTAVSYATNVPAGGTAIEKIYTTEGIAFDSATCRVTGTRH